MMPRSPHEFLDFQVATLNSTELDISNASVRAHKLLCAAVHWYQNFELYETYDDLLRDSCATFGVPKDALNYIIGR